MSPAPPGRPRRRRATAAGSEVAFLGHVLGLARYYHWRHYHTHDSRRSAPGFPDLVLVKAPRLIFAEVKAQDGGRRATLADLERRPGWLQHRDVTNDQADWLEQLSAVAAAVRSAVGTALELGDADASVEVYVWRPADLQDVANILAGGQADGNAAAYAANLTP